MEKLDKYIRDVNLFFTDTLKIDDKYKPSLKEETEINYDNSISLFHLITSFNSLYTSFMQEYERLPKLDLGEYVERCDFYHIKEDYDDARSLLLYIDKPTIAKYPDTYLEIKEVNGEIKTQVTNCLYPFEDDYYCDDVKLDKNKAKKYLDLFEKYNLLFETFYSIRNHQLFGNGYSSVFMHIDKVDCNLLDGLKNLTVSICSNNSKDYTDITMNLGKDFGINYPKCKMVFNLRPVEATKEDYSNVLTNVYLNQKYTKPKRR